jgi:hypothetical protein
MPESNVRVSLGGWGPGYPAVANTADRWNGWLAAPRFDRETLERIAADLRAVESGERVTIDADGVWSWFDEYADEYPDPRGERYEWDADGRCALGAYGWTWTEDDEEA